MRLGDFTNLASNYANRGAYSPAVIDLLIDALKGTRPSRFADIGAGTGKLTGMLVARGLHGDAVEPNDAMRAEGERHVPAGAQLRWRAGSAEATGLESGSADLLTMASAFHWADPARALPEFRRVLRPHGLLAVTWNPRDLEKNPLQKQVEQRIYEIVPDLKRVSSGSASHMTGIEDKLLSTGDFRDVVYVEGRHVESMSRERYLAAWRSVNDIQAQAGAERFERIMQGIAELIAHMDRVDVPYLTRMWIARPRSTG